MYRVSQKRLVLSLLDSIGPSKREKAEKLDIPLVDEIAFLKMIGEEN